VNDKGRERDVESELPDITAVDLAEIMTNPALAAIVEQLANEVPGESVAGFQSAI
jgi:FXSXX-COOH protein